jgi:hypothetical protein
MPGLTLGGVLMVSSIMSASLASDGVQPPLQISGIYPHLAVFSGSGEVGIGAVVPWAGKLWMMTYPPHEIRGSSDKLYAINPDMSVEIRPESVGGTHAGRMIHRESNQLVMGPYFIDSAGKVRACDVNVLVGRMTAVARHLTDPANKVYLIDMEGAIYEVDVHTLAVTRLFEKPVPGWHAKGGYTSQGRLVMSNNGESAAYNKQYTYLAEAPVKSPEDAGVLAEWDGTTWRVVERRQFTEVTGPGGLLGAPDDQSPLWSVGWDRRSVILMLLDGGRWQRFRLPKATHTYDPRHGWYTEWPRIREVGQGRWMMDMHGMFYNFPPTFSASNTGGLSPIASHLRYIPDFCDWNGRLVLAADDASIMQNPMLGQSQSNLWFGSVEALRSFGPPAGWGGPWRQDSVQAGVPSDPFLVKGFDRRVLHLAHDSDETVTFTLEIDRSGDGAWSEYERVPVPAHGYLGKVLPTDFDAVWLRLKADRDCVATAYLHQTSPRDTTQDRPEVFAGLARVEDQAPVIAGVIRPARYNRNLQFVARTTDAWGQVTDRGYWEVDKDLHFVKPDEDRSVEVLQVARVRRDFEVDAASVIMIQDGRRYRLPKGDARYDQPFAWGWPRGIRECVSERYLMNIHGTLYEMPRDHGLPLIKPVCSHGRQIADFCTWRGLMVLCGTRGPVSPDGHCFAGEDGQLGLWLGAFDDLWQLGKPVGKGGPWLNTPVKAQQPSDPYLMTGYDHKRMELSHDADHEVAFAVEVDIDHEQWCRYATFRIPPGETVTHVFPEGYSAHWARVTADADCEASAVLTYE